MTNKINTYQNYIGGKWIDSGDGKTFEQLNPANLKEVTGLWPASTREDARRAIDAAQEAFPAWAALTPYQRMEYFRRVLDLMTQRRDSIAEVITRENGKTLGESRGEIDSAIREMEFQVHEGLRMGGQTLPSSVNGVLAYSLREPLGVVSIISPWNFPFNVPCRKITPALIAGNTCVFKPASLTPGGWAGICEAVCGSGASCRSAEFHYRRRVDSWGRDHDESAGAGDFLYRFDRYRSSDSGEIGIYFDSDTTGVGGEESDGCVGRCGFGCGGSGGRDGGFRLRGTVVHVYEPGYRDAFGRRGFH